MTKKSHVVPHFNCPDLRNTVVPLMTLSVPCNADVVPIISHDQESHVALQFNHLNIRNAMVSLVAILEACDANTSTNGIT